MREGNSMEDKKHRANTIPSVDDAIDAIIAILLENRERSDPVYNLQQIEEHLRALMAHGELLAKGLSGPDQFLSMDQLENLMLQLRQDSNDIDLRAFMAALKNLTDENILIKKKKRSTRKKE